MNADGAKRKTIHTQVKRERDVIGQDKRNRQNKQRDFEITAKNESIEAQEQNDINIR